MPNVLKMCGLIIQQMWRKRFPVISVVIFMLGLSFHLMAGPTNRYVSLSGGDHWPYTNWADAGTNIIDVVNVANGYNEGDMVVVSNGTYILTNSIYVTYSTVSNFNGNRSATVIQGNKQNRCFLMSNSQAAVHGFTITNGKADYGGGVSMVKGGLLNNCTIVGNCATGSSWGMGGGGVYCGRDAGIITNCLIIQNVATQSAFGGGINCDGWANKVKIYNSTIVSNMVFTANCTGRGGGCFVQDCYIYNSVIVMNSADYGAGVAMSHSSYLQNCVISNNTANSRGGGLYLLGWAYVQNCIVILNTAITNGGGGSIEGGGRVGPGLLKNSLVIGNYAGTYGGGVYCNNSSATTGLIANCTIVSNSCGNRGGGLNVDSGANCFMTNSIVYFNSDAAGNSNSYGLKSSTFSFIAPTNDLTTDNINNISGNPQFVDKDTVNWRLRVNSPCVNTGTNQDWMTNSFDLDGRQRIRYGTVDMGAYETIYEGTIYRIP